MGEEGQAPERTIDIQIGANTATPAETGELVNGITQAVVGAAQSWQERMKERAAAKQTAPLAASGAAPVGSADIAR